jgi:Methyltransferase FkbM domain
MNYNFIEIGTSDFETCIHDADDTVVGLSIDPIQLYLDNLPNRKNVRKINAAISNYNGTTHIYYVNPMIIKQFNLPDWYRGCNSIGQPHITVVNGLKSFGLNPEAIITRQEIQVMNIETLFKNNNVGSIDLLKVDTEGHDPVILENYIEYCDAHPKLYAKKILFETNVLSSKTDQEMVISALNARGYRVVEVTSDNTILEKFN